MSRLHRLAILIALVLAASLVGLVPAQAGEPIIPTEATYNITRYDCVATETGFVARGQVKTWVNTVRRPKSRYYQKVTVEIDKLGLGQQWRSMDKRTYSWSVFTKKDLPTYSTSGARTAVGPSIANGGTMTVKFKVKLKRVVPGPDLTTWSYEHRGPVFHCDGNM